jgi:hypothetical protein
MNGKNTNNFIKWLREETEEYRHYSERAPCDGYNGVWYVIIYVGVCIEILR